MKYSEFTIQQNRRFQNAQEENHEVSRHDLYTDAVQEIYDRYELPALWLDETGFNKGETDEEDLCNVIRKINEIEHVDGFDPEFTSWTLDERFNEETEEYDFDDLFLFLDKKLMELELEKYDNVLNKIGF